VYHTEYRMLPFKTALVPICVKCYVIIYIKIINKTKVTLRLDFVYGKLAFLYLVLMWSIWFI